MFNEYTTEKSQSTSPRLALTHAHGYERPSSPRGTGDKGEPSSPPIPREVGTEKKIAFPQDYNHNVDLHQTTSELMPA